jgi:hypothetical protein
MVMDDDKIDDDKKCTSVARHFVGLGNPLVQCRVYCLIRQVDAAIRQEFCPVLPQRMPWSSKFGIKNNFWHCAIVFQS